MFSSLRRWLGAETSGGILLLGAAIVALVWANSPVRDAYHRLAATTFGPDRLHLELSLAAWAADGLLAVFFLVVGLELKHEIRVGSLRDPRRAAVPILAAVGGMTVPAVLFTIVVLANGGTGARGWAIPTATDIAFAVAVLAVAGRGLPLALRTFLLTLAVVDDLLAIVMIAVFYSSDLNLLYLAALIPTVLAFRTIARRDTPQWWVLVPLGLIAWALMHASGVHATVAGVLLGFCVPAATLEDSRAQRWAATLQPWSSGIALPVFAFFSAGVTVVDIGAGALFSSPIAHGVAAGLLAGKIIGVLATTAIVTRWTPLRLAQGIGLRDLLPVGFLTGIGFTVSLLIAELSFSNPAQLSAAKASVLGSSLVAAILGSILLRFDLRKARGSDMNRDGIPDGQLPRIGDVAAPADPEVVPQGRNERC